VTTAPPTAGVFVDAWGLLCVQVLLLPRGIT